MMPLLVRIPSDVEFVVSRETGPVFFSFYRCRAGWQEETEMVGKAKPASLVIVDQQGQSGKSNDLFEVGATDRETQIFSSSPLRPILPHRFLRECVIDVASPRSAHKLPYTAFRRVIMGVLLSLVSDPVLVPRSLDDGSTKT
jgi:hypothetical protein